MHLVFVYGTLRRGERNARLLAAAERLGRARCEGPACTEPRYDLIDLAPTGHPWPAMLGAGPLAVRGELWSVDDRTLAALDRFEGHPSLYVREAIRLEGARTAEAYLWAGAVPSGASPIPTGEAPRRGIVRGQR